jgi:hypothetical protein
LWARIACGSSLGFDNDVYCYAPGGKCDRNTIADDFYLSGRLYQLALTDELLGNGTDERGAPSHHRFRRGGRIQHRHVDQHKRRAAPAPLADSYGPPSTWPFGGDDIPVARDGAVFLPLVQPDDGQLAPFVAHVYVASSQQPRPVNASCPLFSSDPAEYQMSNNTCFANWNVPIAEFDLDPSVPELEAVKQCRAACDANATCDGFDLIKVTPFSGHTKPHCMLYSQPDGCEADDNQWAGVKSPLPAPSPSGPGVDTAWTLPLSWAGKTLRAFTATDAGPVEGLSPVVVNGRDLAVKNITPGVAVRLEAS